jgi:predicted nucleic-acid-binding protein
VTNQKRTGKPRSEQINRAVDEPRGLFDGFEGYRTPTEDDYRRVLTEGLIIPDTNVLLNLYRYNDQAQTDLFAVLEKLGDRLWVPHEVLVEFWRNREAAIRDPQVTAEKTIEALKNQREQALGALRAWANRVALPDERLSDLQEALKGGFAVAHEAISDLIDAEAVDRARDTNRDPVLQKLEPALLGRVGGAWDEAARAAAVKEGLRRVEAGQPPGYKDEDKPSELAAGDYLVWEQVLCEAEQRHCDVLFVTGDVKDDWWRRDRGQTRGPRLELVEEMRSRAGVRLFMTQPKRLLELAAQVLQVVVRKESVQDVERVDRLLAEGESGGWTAAALEELLKRLFARAPVQAAVIHLAADNGGFASREAVYELGGYEETRTLRGFTRPVNRIVQEFRDRGLVPESAPDLLETEYDPSYSYVQASGFRIPQDLIPLINATRAGRSSAAGKDNHPVADTSAAASI